MNESDSFPMTEETKYIFWNVLNQHRNIALNEDLSKFADGDTFWKAMLNLCETMGEWIPSFSAAETDIGHRLRMYNITGINKIEIFLSGDPGCYGVRCANSKSFLRTKTGMEALMAYVRSRAATSVVNTGEIKD